MIRIEHVSKRFGRALAVDDVTLRIAPGESVALWGANGAGKTTLIRCVLGLLRFSGQLTIDGHDARHDGKRARMLIGYVPQELGFYDDLGVAEAVRFFARLKNLPTSSPERVLASVGLEGHQRKRIRELSGGMKQRLALSIALLRDPPILVLDEVTASLDACGRDEFVRLLAGLAGKGRTMLFASHRVEEVVALSNRVVTLDRGRAVSVASSREFANGPGSGLVLHLTLPIAVREHAMDRLRAGGFSPSLNGVGVLVPVTAEHKAAPFRLLAEARIAIDDFELRTHAAPRSEASNHQETDR